jgi:hypothetical protein
MFGMTYIEDIMREVANVTPKYGFNVCSFDDWEDVGERLEVLGHFDTMVEAQQFADQYEDKVIFIYAGEEEADEGMSVIKNHSVDDYIAKAIDDYEKGKNSPNEDYEKINYGGEAFLGSRGKSHEYGIQNMLDDIVGNSLSTGEKQEVSEKVEDGFTLNVLLDLVAEKLAKKAGKKLGVEGISDKWDEEEKKRDNLPHGYQDVDYEDTRFDEPEFEPWQKGGEVKFEKCYGCMGSGRFVDGSVCQICGGTGVVDQDTKTAGVEYGIKGVSGRSGHKKWMLEGEAQDDCPNCMIQTDKDDDGKCILCGN